MDSIAVTAQRAAPILPHGDVYYRGRLVDLHTRSVQQTLLPDSACTSLWIVAHPMVCDYPPQRGIYGCHHGLASEYPFRR